MRDWLIPRTSLLSSAALAKIRECCTKLPTFGRSFAMKSTRRCVAKV
ncbi:unnamed protein product [Symbiodinium pilosum]|uniref:Uncharacterized protein n=1 Tax=Symbiodinium pilosum TaxID=2952 RepID=A0A812WTS8_SYMPI|nr:unnamed protein product [Symbiodinium pilosum]